jgi:predicted Zn-dependent protease
LDEDSKERSKAVAVAFAVVLLASVGCASGDRRPDGPNYVKYVSFEMPGNEDVLLRWSKRHMPLAVYLARPDPNHFEDPDALFDVVRDGIVDWENAAGPGIPSFEFVDDQGDADIPIQWETDLAGAWFIGHCVYDIDVMTRRFGVAHIVVTGKVREGVDADPDQVYATMLHEVGHALGLGGHSPDPADVMYRHGTSLQSELTERDRETLRLLYERPSGRRLIGARDAD